MRRYRYVFSGLEMKLLRRNCRAKKEEVKKARNATKFFIIHSIHLTSYE
jgi:hypothetical protein